LIQKRDCPYFNLYDLPSKLIVALGKTFLSIIKESIELGMYIFAYIDSTKIEQYLKLDVTLNIHEIFIYGYDDEKEIVHFADFPINDAFKYTHSTCTYKEIEDAFTGILDFTYPLNKSIGLIKYTNESPFVFDFKYVQDSIRWYIEPDRNIAEDFNRYAMSTFSFIGWETKTYLGVDVYDFFVRQITLDANAGRSIFSLELFHGLYDHKEMMIRRIAYFIKNGYMSNEKLSLLTDYKEIRDKALIVRNLVIKYNINSDKKLISRISMLLTEMKVREIQLLKGVFSL